MSNHTPNHIQIPLPLEGETIEVFLNKELVALVDAIDADLAQYRWQATPKATSFYATRVFPPYINKRGKRVSLHRIIMERVEMRPLLPSEIVDHKNGNTLDCRRSNLRIATNAQNSSNSKLRAGSKTGYKGVAFINNNWRARICVNYKTIDLGRYINPEEAAIAYNHAALKYFGEFARFNEIDNWRNRTPISPTLLKTNTSGYAGISKERGKWRAYARINGKSKHIGLFETIEEAYEARCKFIEENKT